MENSIIKQFIHYLTYRDVLLLAAVSTHIILYFNLIPDNRVWLYSVLAVGTLLWTLYHARSVFMYYKMKKDAYFSEAVKDEYLTQVKLKAGYHGYTSVFFVCLTFIIGSLFLKEIAVPIGLPSYLTCETVLLVAIITDDISKISQLKG